MGQRIQEIAKEREWESDKSRLRFRKIALVSQEVPLPRYICRRKQPNSFQGLFMKTTFLTALLGGFSLLLVSFPLASAEHVPSTPVQVVQEWTKTYPHHLDRAVMLTSPAAREDLTTTQWVTAQKIVLAPKKLDYTNREIVSIRDHGYQVVVILKTQLSTINGKEEQWEQVTLRPFCSTWLIDEIELIPTRHLVNAK